jgi:hypothetical protein
MEQGGGCVRESVAPGLTPLEEGASKKGPADLAGPCLVIEGAF